MDKRSFPRYNILALNAYIIVEGQQNKIWVKDISLGGVQCLHTERLLIKKSQKATFYLGQKFIRKLQLQEVWSKESIAQIDGPLKMNEVLTQKLNKITNLSGFQLFFEELEEFKDWRTLVQAMHKHKMKELSND